MLDRLIGITLTRIQLLAAGMSVFGVALLSFDGSAVSFAIGDFWLLVQAIAFGVGFWRTEHALQRFPDEANRITAARLLSCFLLSLVYTIITCVVEGSTPTLQQWWQWFSSAEIMIALVWTGIITTALTTYLETVAMKTVSAAESTLLLSSDPFWASLFAWILCGETLGALGSIGGVFIVGACVVSMW